MPKSYTCSSKIVAIEGAELRTADGYNFRARYVKSIEMFAFMSGMLKLSRYNIDIHIYARALQYPYYYLKRARSIYVSFIYALILYFWIIFSYNILYANKIK